MWRPVQTGWGVANVVQSRRVTRAWPRLVESTVLRMWQPSKSIFLSWEACKLPCRSTASKQTPHAVAGTCPGPVLPHRFFSCCHRCTGQAFPSNIVQIPSGSSWSDSTYILRNLQPVRSAFNFHLLCSQRETKAVGLSIIVDATAHRTSNVSAMGPRIQTATFTTQPQPAKSLCSIQHRHKVPTPCPEHLSPQGVSVAPSGSVPKVRCRM